MGSIELHHASSTSLDDNSSLRTAPDRDPLVGFELVIEDGCPHFPPFAWLGAPRGRSLTFGRINEQMVIVKWARIIYCPSSYRILICSLFSLEEFWAYIDLNINEKASLSMEMFNRKTIEKQSKSVL